MKLELSPDWLAQHRDCSVSDIIRVLRSDIRKYWSWGTHGLINMNGKGLRMRVSGIRHKGWVYVMLNGSDLFDIYLTNLKNDIKEKVADVHVEDLAEVADHYIESGVGDYKAKVQKWMAQTITKI
jgi:hypothetical protein